MLVREYPIKNVRSEGFSGTLKITSLGILLKFLSLVCNSNTLKNKFQEKRIITIANTQSKIH